jgi:hypothetical protein
MLRVLRVLQRSEFAWDDLRRGHFWGKRVGLRRGLGLSFIPAMLTACSDDAFRESLNNRP